MSCPTCEEAALRYYESESEYLPDDWRERRREWAKGLVIELHSIHLRGFAGCQAASTQLAEPKCYETECCGPEVEMRKELAKHIHNLTLGDSSPLADIERQAELRGLEYAHEKCGWCSGITGAEYRPEYCKIAKRIAELKRELEGK